MALSDELAYMDATELALRIRRRDLSPVEVVDAFIARIEVRNPSLNALVFYGFEDARREAKAAERALMSGEALGPLHGVPCALKDLFHFKPGWKSSFGGVRALKDFTPDFYCAFAERIEKSGAILLGKTNSPVMGFRGACDNYLFGPSRNPFRPSRNTGGSSGGSAGAVADGMLPLAEGTDGGGSIRIPASWCGVYGYKASFGRVPFYPRPNAFGGDAPFLFEGPITHTVGDAALALTALSGYDPRDPTAWTRRSTSPPLRVALSAAGRSPTARISTFFRSTEAEVVANAVRAFEEAGAHVEEVKVGIERPQRELSDLWCRLIMPLNVQTFEVFKQNGLDLLRDHRDDFPPEYLRWVEEGYRMSALDFFRDQEVRTEVYDAIQGVLNCHDLLITPTLACTAVENAKDGNTMGPAEVEGEAVDRLIGWCLTYLINFTGHPAASIPAGMADGLPVGMQIIGRRYADADVLAASAAFERLRPWHDHYRTCAQSPCRPPGREAHRANLDRRRMVRPLDAVTIGEPWWAALRLAWEAHRMGNIGVGAVLTGPAGVIVTTGRNRVFDADAPPGRLRSTYLAHAEMDALAQLPHGDYPDHTLWTTLEPCLMCASALVLSHVGTVRYAAADPLWSGIDRMAGLNAQAARRWPIRHGPLYGPIAAFCGLLPLVWAVRRKADGVVARAYQEHDPALIALARRLDRNGALDALRGGPVEHALARLWDDLCDVAAPAEEPG